MKLLDNPKGNYRFLTGIAPYSSGVVAMPGYEVVHVTLHQPKPYQQGFALIDQHLAEQNRPRQALCAIELRSPAPFTFEGFAEFNQGYQTILADWGLLLDDGHNPIARTNVAPVVAAPDEPVLYGFSYTVAGDAEAEPTFVVAGAGELRGTGLLPENIVRPNETSDEAIRDKAVQVMSTMSARLAGLQMGWSQITAVDIYTAHALQSFLAAEILAVMGPAAIHGVRWFYSRPPISGLEYEMDMRGIRRELRL